jgi:thiol-disulfide isomerase/thioredoxin
MRCLDAELAFLVFFSLVVAGCGDASHSSQLPVSHDASIAFILNDSVTASFLGSRKGAAWSLYNGDEVVTLTPLNDSTWKVPVFNGSWMLRKDQKNNSYRGHWVDSLRNPPGSYRVPLRVLPKSSSAQATSEPPEIPTGTWDVWFGEDSSDSPGSQLDLTTEDGAVRATIRTPTGDYRYLAGTLVDNALQLQTFDGAHLFVFTASLQGGSWVGGHFYSGNHYHTTWRAASAAPTPDQNPMRSLVVPDEDLRVSVVNRAGNSNSIPLRSDSLIVLDILGTWCPNCMDEVRLLRELYTPQARFLSVAFERDTSPVSSYERLDAFADELNLDWALFLGGKASKKSAADAFPFLDRVISFPTTLFIRGNDVMVHSGFNGPATGERYTMEKKRFQDQLNNFTSLENR